MKEEYLDWVEHPCTKEFFSDTNITLDSYKEMISSGGTLGGDPVQDTAKTVGTIQALQGVVHWQPDFIDYASGEE